jgi:hypothetical protein
MAGKRLVAAQDAHWRSTSGRYEERCSDDEQQGELPHGSLLSYASDKHRWGGPYTNPTPRRLG